MVPEHEAAALTRMGVEVEEHLEALVLLGLLDDCKARRPNRRMVTLGRVKIQSVQVAGHRIESVVTSGDAVWIQDHDDFEDEVLSKATSLVAPQTEPKTKCSTLPIFGTYSHSNSRNPFKTWLPGVSPGCTLEVKKITGFSFLNRSDRERGFLSAAGKIPRPSAGIVSCSSVIWSFDDMVSSSIGRPSSE